MTKSLPVGNPVNESNDHEIEKTFLNEDNSVVPEDHVAEFGGVFSSKPSVILEEADARVDQVEQSVEGEDQEQGAHAHHKEVGPQLHPIEAFNTVHVIALQIGTVILRQV